MKIVVNRRGGITGIKDRIEINDCTISHSWELPIEKQEGLAQLVSELLDSEIKITKLGFTPCDAVEQTIVLEMDGKPSKTLQIVSCDHAPNALWALLYLVDHLSH